MSSKINPEDIVLLHFEKDDCGEEQFKLTIECKSKEDFELKKQQILSNDMIEERLESNTIELVDINNELAKERDNLKEQLRRFEVLQYTPNELEIELNKGIILKEKIEKIKVFQDDLECGNNHSDEYPDFIKKEILGEMK